MVTTSLLLALHPEGPMGHDKLESAMFWVGAMLAFTPVLVGLGVFGLIWWHRRKAGAPGGAPAAAGPPPGEHDEL
jgi:hypothetical protein